jgi:hypothetical protein
MGASNGARNPDGTVCSAQFLMMSDVLKNSTELTDLTNFRGTTVEVARFLHGASPF